MTVQAAIDGIGVAMGRTSYVQDDIAKGRLVVPFKITLPADAGFYLVSPQAKADSPKLSAFRNGWSRRRADQARTSRGWPRCIGLAMAAAQPPWRIFRRRMQNWQQECMVDLTRKYDVLVIGGGNAALVRRDQRAARPARRCWCWRRAPKFYRGGNTRHTRNMRCAHDAATEHPDRPLHRGRVLGRSAARHRRPDRRAAGAAS